MRNILILGLFALLTGSLIYFDGQNNSNVVIEFEKLRPVSEKINVYYNGFKIGHSKKFSPCENARHICLGVSLKNNVMFLPENISAKMKQKKVHDRKYEDYIELIYPATPSHLPLKSGSIINGELSSGFHNYINEEISFSDMEDLKESLSNSVENIEKMTSALVNVMHNIDETTKKSEGNLQNTFKNVDMMTKNLANISNKIDSSIDPEAMQGIIRNIDGITGNVNEFTGEFNDSSSNIGETLSSIESITRNTDEIVQGVNCTLRKPFGGFRLMFGKVVK